jgi:hypothetical protein
MSNIDAKQILDRFIRTIENLRERQPLNTALYKALDYILNKIRDRATYVISDLKLVYYDTNVPPVVSFNYLICPHCNRIFSFDKVKPEDDGYYYCPHCIANNIKARLVQAYVGVPHIDGINRDNPIRFTGLEAQQENYYVQPTSKIVDIRWCQNQKYKNKKVMKGLRATNPRRPLQSLRFVCPFDDKSCEHYDHQNPGLCTLGKQSPVTFPKLRNGRYVVSKPSTAITKPFSVTVFSPSPISKLDLAVKAETVNEVMRKVIPIIDDVQPGKFNVYELTIMYLLGHPYSRRLSKIPVIVEDQRGNVNFLGRRLQTDGVLFKLNYQGVEKIVEEINNIPGVVHVDPFTVVHSLSHVMLLALTRLTGLSPNEFGESIFVDEEGQVAEILIYDNSPQGIGGVKTAINNYSEFLSAICNFAQPCPRACRSACRACIFFEACPLQNFSLSWRASTRAVDRGACLGGP